MCIDVCVEGRRACEIASKCLQDQLCLQTMSLGNGPEREAIFETNIRKILPAEN